MTEATEILVVINSVVLIVFLVVGLVLLVQVILLIRRIRKLAEKAEVVAGNFEAISSTLRQAAFGAGVGGVIKNIFTVFAKQSKKGSKKS